MKHASSKTFLLYRYIIKIIKILVFIYLAVVIVDQSLLVMGHNTILIQAIPIFPELAIACSILAGLIIFFSFLDLLFKRKYRRVVLNLFFMLSAIILFSVSISFIGKKAVDLAFKDVYHLFYRGSTDHDIEFDKKAKAYFLETIDSFESKNIHLKHYSIINANFLFLYKNNSTKERLFISQTRTTGGLKYWIYTD